MSGLRGWLVGDQPAITRIGSVMFVTTVGAIVMAATRHRLISYGLVMVTTALAVVFIVTRAKAVDAPWLGATGVALEMIAVIFFWLPLKFFYVSIVAWLPAITVIYILYFKHIPDDPNASGERHVTVPVHPVSTEAAASSPDTAPSRRPVVTDPDFKYLPPQKSQ